MTEKIEKGTRMKCFLCIASETGMNLLDDNAVSKFKEAHAIQAIKEAVDEFEDETGQTATSIAVPGNLQSLARDSYNNGREKWNECHEDEPRRKYISYSDDLVLDGVKVVSGCNLEDTECYVYSWTE
jgi:hypothetical protein